MDQLDLLKAVERMPLRPRQVSALVAYGMTDQEIAAQLSLDVATVQAHMKVARRIFQVDSRLKMVLLIVRRPKLEKLLRTSLGQVPKSGRRRSAATAAPPCDNGPGRDKQEASHSS